MKLDALVNRLEAYLQEERGAQGRLLALLDEQERAVRAGDTPALEAAGLALAAELATESSRESRRSALVTAFAAELGVPAAIVTVGSTIERLRARGQSLERLERLRAELREALLAVRSKARRLAVLARGHQEVLADVMRLLVGDETGSSGVLVNAEA